jgi:hypothetical protein
MTGTDATGEGTTAKASPGDLPLVDGPLAGTAFTFFYPRGLGIPGYVEEEYFLTGQAQSYEIVGDRTSDGRWSVRPAEQAGYTTRIVVRRPGDADRYNGSVLVEWFNVSTGTDGEPDWAFTHRHIIREGFAWVGVSAQKAGIDGGGISEGRHLKSVDADRYKTLSHPGDAFSFDIFSQAGRLVRDADGHSLLGPLRAERVLAAGESQSAACLITYINAIDPVARVYDGFLVHGRGAAGSNMDGFRLSANADGSPDLEAARAAMAKNPERIREDVRVPVLTLQSETDVAGMRGSLARQPDNDRFRLWEVAGAAHADTYVFSAEKDDGTLSAEQLAALLAPTTHAPNRSSGTGFTTGAPVNSGPQQHYVSQSALAHLDRWVRDGTPPPQADRLELSGDDRLEVDGHGIARGGVRTPWVDVPIALLSGLGQEGAATFAFVLGSTLPFSPEQLEHMYPGGRQSYVERFGKSLDDAVAKSFLLDADAEEIIQLAAASFPK